MTDLSADLFGVSPDNSAVSSAILGQESGNTANAPTSIDNAIGRAQITPDTFKQYALPGEDINNDADNLAVHNRIIHDLSQKAGGDPARVAVGYFSGPGNIAPPDSDTPWKADHKDGNGKSVSSYVSDVMGRMNPISTAQASETPAPRDLSAELFGDQPSGKDLSSEIFDSKEQQPQSLIDALKSQDPRNIYQATMNTVAKPINTAVNSVVSPVMGAVASAEAPAAQGVANAIDSTGAGQWIGDKLLAAKNAVSDVGANIKDLESYSPGNTLAKDLSAFGENAQLLGNLTAAKVPLESAANTLGESAAKSLTRPEGVFPEVRAANASDYNPIATHSAISDAYGAAKKATQPYYNLMNDIASGETADASGLKPALDSMIDDIQNTPFHEATSELSYLKQQSAKIGEDGTMPLADMVKLKQNLNSNFNPKRFAQGADTPYSTVGGLVDDSLADAADRIPEFGEAKSLADKNWLNTVKSPFEDNTVLQKFWKPEDYYAKKSVDSGMLETLPDPTLQRAASMLGGIKTPVQLNAIRRVIPQSMSDALSAAKIQDITQGAGTSRLNSAGKALMGAPNLTPSGIGKTLTNIGQTIGGVPLKQAQKDLIAAAKIPSPTLSTKYQKPFSDLKASVNASRQQQADLAGEMQPYGVPTAKPKPILRLPAPETTNVVNTYGQNVQVTPAGRDIIGQSPSTVAEQTPADIARANNAATQSQSEMLAKYGARRVLGSENAAPVPTTKGNPDAIWAAKLAQARGFTPQRSLPALPAPENGTGFVSTQQGIRAATQSENFKNSQEAIKQAASVWDGQAARLQANGYTPRQITQRLGYRPTLSSPLKVTITPDNKLPDVNLPVVPRGNVTPETPPVPVISRSFSPPTGGKFPVTNLLKSKGGVQTGSNLAGELQAIGVTPQSAPGLFVASGGLKDVDNFPYSEWKLSAAPSDSTGHYVDRDYILNALASECAGKPITQQGAMPLQGKVEPGSQEDLHIYAHSQGIDTTGKSDDEIMKALHEREGIQNHAKGGIIKNRELHLSKKLEVKLGRKPKAREVELASYVGAHGVHRLLNQKDVKLPAHKMFPESTVKEKRELFFNKRKPYTVEQIKRALG